MWFLNIQKRLLLHDRIIRIMTMHIFSYPCITRKKVKDFDEIWCEQHVTEDYAYFI